MQVTSLENIINSTGRTHFTSGDAEMMTSVLMKYHAKGARVNLHPLMAGSVKEAFDDGVIVLRGEDLDVDFVFVKVTAGRGLLGRKKSRVLTFVGEVEREELTPGPVFDGFGRALLSIAAVYKSQGKM